MKNGIFFKIGLVALSAIVVLTALEISCRIEHHKMQAALKSKYSGRDLCVAADRKLIYTYIPNACGHNSRGYYDYEYPYQKDKGILRVIVIGDSIAEGHSLGLGGSFPKILEDKLNSSGYPKKCEVIVLARSGYSTSQELTLLRTEAFRYQPDIILWSYCLNDPADPVWHDANGEYGRLFYNPPLHCLYFLAERVSRLAENIKAQGCTYNSFDGLLHCIYWDQVKRDIKEIGAITSNHRVPVFFLIHPDFEMRATWHEYSLAPLHRKLATIASENGLIAVDLLDCYKQYHPDEIRLRQNSIYDPWHLNARGQAAVADYVYQILENHLSRGNWKE